MCENAATGAGYTRAAMTAPLPRPSRRRRPPPRRARADRPRACCCCCSAGRRRAAARAATRHGRAATHPVDPAGPARAAPRRADARPQAPSRTPVRAARAITLRARAPARSRPCRAVTGDRRRARAAPAAQPSRARRRRRLAAPPPAARRCCRTRAARRRQRRPRAAQGKQSVHRGAAGQPADPHAQGHARPPPTWRRTPGTRRPRWTELVNNTGDGARRTRVIRAAAPTASRTPRRTTQHRHDRKARQAAHHELPGSTNRRPAPGMENGARP